MALAAVVFDFDGVVRHWDPARTTAIEARHDLPEGAIMDAAFGPELGRAAITGELTYEEWLDLIAERIGSVAAAVEWSEHRGDVDPVATAFVAEVRATGVTVGLLSNATSRLPSEIEFLGLAPLFDHVFSTSELGVCKPEPAAYQAVLDRLGLPGEQVAFTDDLPDWAEAANTVGMHGIPFRGFTSLRLELQALGLPL